MTDHRPSDQSLERWTPTPLQGVTLVYRAVLPKLLSVARKLGADDAADDVVQDAVMAMIRRLTEQGAIESAEEREALLFSLVQDIARQRWRRERRRSALSAFINGPTEAMRRWTSASLPQQNSELLAQVDRTLATLPRCWAECFVLVHDHAMTFETAGRLLNITTSSARSYFARACARLRKDLLAAGLDPRDSREPWNP